MGVSYAVLCAVGLALVTVLTRGFFLLSERDLTLPPWAMQGLRYAPLAALVAVIAPEIVLTDGVLIATWADARIYAVLVGTAYFCVAARHSRHHRQRHGRAAGAQSWARLVTLAQLLQNPCMRRTSLSPR